MRWCDLCEGDTIVSVNERDDHLYVMLPGHMGLDIMTGRIMLVKSDGYEMTGWEVFRPER